MTDVDELSDLAPGVRNWYVLHVKPRTEKKVMLYLERYGGFRYLPLVLKITKVQRRKVRRQIPVFPGYVFSRLSPEERFEMLRTNLIVSTIRVTRPREMIHQLRQIEHASRCSPNMRRVQPFKEGDYVRVVSGPMRGTEGYVRREGANATICLNVEILGAAVELSVSPGNLEKISPVAVKAKPECCSKQNRNGARGSVKRASARDSASKTAVVDG